MFNTVVPSWGLIKAALQPRTLINVFNEHSHSVISVTSSTFGRVTEAVECFCVTEVVTKRLNNIQQHFAQRFLSEESRSNSLKGKTT